MPWQGYPSDILAWNSPMAFEPAHDPRSKGMTLVSTVAAIALLVVLAVILSRRATSADPAHFPFTQCAPLSEREQVLYWRLRKVLPEQMVLSQVAISRIVRVNRGKDARGWMNRINRMTVDFLVCLPDATIVAAIELDDSSHAAPDRVAADAKKDKAMESAGIRLLRFSEIPTEDDLRKAFLG